MYQAKKRPFCVVAEISVGTPHGTRVNEQASNAWRNGGEARHNSGGELPRRGTRAWCSGSSSPPPGGAGEGAGPYERRTAGA